MYFFYLDESGDRNPTVKQEEPFVLVAVGMHEFQWRKFEAEINSSKRELIRKISARTGVMLDLANAEVHSTPIRIPKQREKHPFLKHLTDAELSGIVEFFYSQLEKRHCTIIAAVIDKTCLHPFMTLEKVSKKVYELILERVETFIAMEHPKQQALIILDNTTRELNRSIAMKQFFQQSETSSGVKLRHIVEMLLFVESYLSNGVQLADLCAYNVFRAFRNTDATYGHFLRILPAFCKNPNTSKDKLEGLKAFPDEHRWREFLEKVQIERARML